MLQVQGYLKLNPEAPLTTMSSRTLPDPIIDRWDNIEDNEAADDVLPLSEATTSFLITHLRMSPEFIYNVLNESFGCSLFSMSSQLLR